MKMLYTLYKSDAKFLKLINNSWRENKENPHHKGGLDIRFLF